MKHEAANDRTNREEQALLVERARSGCRTSFAHLARHWHPRLIAHAYRLLGDREQAHDATQSAWVEIARGIRKLRDPLAFPAWSYRIVTRRCASLVSSLQTDRALISELSIDAGEPGDWQADASMSVLVRRAITRLPAGQRAALALFYHEGLSVAETAVALDIPAGTVKTRLMHARRNLAELLKGDAP